MCEIVQSCVLGCESEEQHDQRFARAEEIILEYYEDPR